MLFSVRTLLLLIGILSCLVFRDSVSRRIMLTSTAGACSDAWVRFLNLWDWQWMTRLTLLTEHFQNINTGYFGTRKGTSTVFSVEKQKFVHSWGCESCSKQRVLSEFRWKNNLCHAQILPALTCFLPEWDKERQWKKRWGATELLQDVDRLCSYASSSIHLHTRRSFSEARLQTQRWQRGHSTPFWGGFEQIMWEPNNRAKKGSCKWPTRVTPRSHLF